MEENGHLGMAECDEREQGAERQRVAVMVRGQGERQGSFKAVEHWCMGELEASFSGRKPWGPEDLGVLSGLGRRHESDCLLPLV